MNLRRIHLSIAGLCLAALLTPLSLFSQIAPAEQLLSDDVVGLVTIPDWKKLATAYEQSAWGRLLADSAMKPFRDNFSSNLQADFLKPLEKQLGVKLEDYKELLQGQITFAVTPPKEGTKQFSSFLFLMDAKDKSELLTSKLNELKKKWADSGKEVKTEKIREVEFASVSLAGADIDSVLKKAFPSADEEKEKDKDDGKGAPEKTQLRIGQYKSLLIIGENEKAIEKLLARQSGGLVAPLADKASYQKSHALMFRDSVAHAWVNIKPIYQKALQYLAAEPQEPQPGAPMPMMKVDKIMPALGFSSIETLGAKIGANGEGSSFEVMLGVPEAQREGLFKIFTLEKKESSPPPFVPADVIKFQRTRLDAQKAWATLENMLQRIDPATAGLVQLLLSSAGKDKDPNFDLKKNLFGNLGDDFIQYQKAPVTRKVTELDTPPSLLLIGSPNPPQLLDAIRTLSGLLPTGGGPMKEREFLGKKIYSLSMAASPMDLSGPPGAKPEADDDKPAVAGKKLNFTTSAGYVAFSADDGILEDYLRSSENPPKPLRASPELAEAAQKIGGMENGLFSYENQAESLRATMATLKNDPEGFNRMLFFSLSHGDEEGQGIFKHLFDLKLLPSFERVSKYFGIAVVSGATTADGLVVKGFSPTPAGLKK